jgi:DNA-binding transcriptional LysR family regulator
VVTRCPYFGLIPAMVADSLLVLTTGRHYCERFIDALPVQILPCPVPFPRMRYYQLWHERTHSSNAGRWLREQIKSVAASLRKPETDALAAA